MVDYQKEIADNLEKSINDERQAINDYTERKNAGASDVETAKLYEHVIKEEHAHEKEFIHRFAEVSEKIAAQNDVSETQLRCAAAGLELAKEHGSFKADLTSPIVFPRPSMYGRENLMIADSEYTQKAGSAGKQIVAIFLVAGPDPIAFVVHDDGKGGCGYLKGKPEELVKAPALEKLKEQHPYLKGG